MLFGRMTSGRENGSDTYGTKLRQKPHSIRHSGADRNPVGYRPIVVLDPGLRRDDDSIRLNFVPFGSDTYKGVYKSDRA